MPIPSDLPPWATGNYAAGSDSWSATARRVATDVVSFAAAGLTPNLRTRAQSFNEWLARIQEWVEWFRTERGLGTFGDGSLGAVTLGANTTLLGPAFCTNLTIPSGWVLTTAGYPIFCTGTLTVTGAGSAIRWNGNDASGVTPGAALTATALRGGGAGASGGTPTVAGSNASPIAGAFRTLSPQGGNGGAGDAAGGAGGDWNAATGPTRDRFAATTGHTWANGTLIAIGGGAGGGGGGGGSGVGILGGSGGGGAGVIVIVARALVLDDGGTIEAIGGDGSDGGGPDVVGGGGGGGGGGGVIYLATRESDESGGSVLVTGGAGGAAGDAAAFAGDDGQDGEILRCPV